MGRRQVGALLHRVPSSVLLCLEAVVAVGRVRAEFVESLFKGFVVKDVLRCEVTFVHRHDVHLVVGLLLDRMLFDPLSNRGVWRSGRTTSFCAIEVPASGSPECLAVS